MRDGTLTIYSASAGSGKTFRLAGIYLAQLFRSRYSYRKILAVTFTNKATAEMKGRILDQLYKLSCGEKSDYLGELIASTGKDETWLRTEAGEILNAVLHDFSRFSVSTIDAFFQKVIRSFAREMGLHSGFNIELDNSIILSEAVDQMLASAKDDRDLSGWLDRYVNARLNEEKSWNLKEGIIKLSKELFREEFKILSTDQFGKLKDKKFLHDYVAKIEAIKHTYEKSLTALASEALLLFSEFELSDDMFFSKGKGVPGFLRNVAAGKFKEPNSFVKKINDEPPKWATGRTAPQLQAAIDDGLGAKVREMLDIFRNDTVFYRSASAVLDNIYALGILSDVLEKVHEVATSENSFLISDSGDLLWQITRGEQAPFIYEKIGNFFENFMIDEFQDTSLLQWKNFEPLIANSMGEGHDNLVVGDVKQSIYRFRNSDWRILKNMQENSVDGKRILSIPLLTNWRSRSNIINFNNSLFSVIPQIADKSFQEKSAGLSFRTIFSESLQDDHAPGSGGYVRIEMINSPVPEKDADSGEEFIAAALKWQDSVLDKLPGIIESVQAKGYKASDIGILVRGSREGAMVLGKMIAYGNLHQGSCNYNVVSNDSLTLSNSHAVTFIISVLKVLDSGDDQISKAEMIRFYSLATGKTDPESVPLIIESFDDGGAACLPEGYVAFIKTIAGMSLFEAVENIILFFQLGEYPWNVPYLNTFQDMVTNFTTGKNSGLDLFLEWWENTGKNKSVVLPADQDAAKVFTIHKSKGLEFPIVIIPFISWHTDYEPSKQPYIWLSPAEEPFSDLGILPLRYGEKLNHTLFTGDYLREKYSCFLDNINLLYVAMTRAVDAMYGFLPASPGKSNGISKLIIEALACNENPAGEKGFILTDHVSADKTLFELGELPVRKSVESTREEVVSDRYLVTRKPGSLRLKLHGENYFSSEGEAIRRKINYGKLMHEVFEKIDSEDDIGEAVSRLVMEGKIVSSDAAPLETRIRELVSSPEVKDWFKKGSSVLKEADILMPSGTTRRPDRIVLINGRAIIIDFKFGEEKEHYFRQVGEYLNLLSQMGYADSEGYIWYVEKNKVVRV
jgi:ATP-dependent helicase/nuclease subunit A